MSKKKSFMEHSDDDKEKNHLTVLVVVRCNLYFEGIRRLLREGEKQTVRFEVYDVQSIGSLKPDIIVIDEKAVNAKIIEGYRNAKVVLVFNSFEKGDVASLPSMCRIHGVITPHTDVISFRKALEEVGRGEMWLDKEVISQLLNNSHDLDHEGICLGNASLREQEVIRHVCAGYSNKDIASMIGITERTVKAHLYRIYKKFNVTSRLELVILALKKNSD